MGANQNSPSRTWHIFQNQPKTPLFQLGQDRLAMNKLSTFRTGLGTAAETRNGASKISCKIDNKN
jgi:hypothetical protein